jgi:hypothetical protein
MKEYLINRSDTPAFPLHNHGTQTLGMHFTGMTLRDYFAAKAMQGLIASLQEGEDFTERGCEWTYKVADAMMEARKA